MKQSDYTLLFEQLLEEKKEVALMSFILEHSNLPGPTDNYQQAKISVLSSFKKAISKGHLNAHFLDDFVHY